MNLAVCNANMSHHTTHDLQFYEKVQLHSFLILGLHLSNYFHPKRLRPPLIFSCRHTYSSCRSHSSHFVQFVEQNLLNCGSFCPIQNSLFPRRDSFAVSG